MNQYLPAYRDALAELTGQLKPALLHAASNWMNGVAANSVARMYGLPSIYEVRGLWEITIVSRRPGWEHSRANLVGRTDCG